MATKKQPRPIPLDCFPSETGDEPTSRIHPLRVLREISPDTREPFPAYSVHALERFTPRRREMSR